MAYFLAYAVITQGIYSGIISTIGLATMKTCSVIKSIYLHQNPDASKIMTELDIERKLKLIQSVLNTIDHASPQNEARLKLNNLEKTQIFELVGAETDLEKDPIELCLYYLHDAIQKIHNDLTTINEKVAHHNTKWLSSWRTLFIIPLFDNLKLNSNLLDTRFNDLIKISTFLKNRAS